MRLAGKVAIITGAGQGIGMATALKFAAEGATVVACDIQPHAASDVAARCRQLGAIADSFHVDVTVRSSIDTMVAEVRAAYRTIDVLVNNAGIVRDAAFHKMTIDQFDEVVDVNLRGVFHASQAVLAAMVQQASGVILNASSIVGMYGNYGQTNYAAAKFGVIGFTKTWSRELGPKGIRVNAVAPGFIETPMLSAMPEAVLTRLRDQIPLKRLGRPEEIANIYAFLASDEASYINGSVIEATGGMSL